MMSKPVVDVSLSQGAWGLYIGRYEAMSVLLVFYRLRRDTVRSLIIDKAYLRLSYSTVVGLAMYGGTVI
jgi:hypothetical protein